MKRAVVRAFGPAEQVVGIEAVPVPAPGDTQVLTQMLAASINPSDRLTIAGAYPHRTPLPFVPGFESVGVVEAVGRGVRGLAVGDRVLPLGSTGGWQAAKVTEADWCVLAPPDLSDAQLALGYVNPLTARLMMEAMRPQPGSVIAINAAASAIGRMLIRGVRAAGASPVAVVRSVASRARLRDEPVATTLLDHERLPPCDGAFDAVGGRSGATLAGAVRRGGRLLHYGLLSGQPLPPDLASAAGIEVRLFFLRAWVHGAPRPALRRAMTAVFEDIRSGLAASAIDRRFPLGEVRAALSRDSAAGRRGKVLLTAD